MRRKAKNAIGLLALVTATAFAATPAYAGTTAYPAMAPVEQYLMADRTAEIALARSAAPAAISDDATIMALGHGGYETVAKGTNGFVCLVERAWMSPFDSPEFWSPKLRGPVCYNPPAARSVLPRTLKRTALALAGKPKLAMLDAIKAAVAKKDLRAPEIGSMSYMMSHQQYLGDDAGAWAPHLMFHLPKTDAASWGADLPGSPVMLDTDHTEVPEPETIFMIAARKWSDGTPFVPGENHSH